MWLASAVMAARSAKGATAPAAAAPGSAGDGAQTSAEAPATAATAATPSITLRYSAADLAHALRSDRYVVWHDEYEAELAALDLDDRAFADHGALMMWLAGAVMAARAPIKAQTEAAPTVVGSDTDADTAPETVAETVAVPAPAAAVAVPTPTEAVAVPTPRATPAAAGRPPTQVTLAQLYKAAPVGATAGQRYDKQGATHTSVTFKFVDSKNGIVRISGFHRTLADGGHYYWAKHTGGGAFVLSTSGGSAIETVPRSAVLENAWKAVRKVAAKLGCTAVEPTWT
jgi:hypothetical protein